LGSKNVINLLDVFFTPGNIKSLVLEFAPGGDLLAFDVFEFELDDQRAFVKRVFLEMAIAVNEVHDAGYCHRDIKLENFLFMQNVSEPITDSTLVKIANFGQANQILNREDDYMFGNTLNRPKSYSMHSHSFLATSSDQSTAKKQTFGVSVAAFTIL